MNNTRQWQTHIFLAVAASYLMILTGCTMGPDYHPPHTKTPDRWVGTVNSQPTRLNRWWRRFNDSELTHLVEQAISVNLDVQLAQARLRESRAARDVIAGGTLPSVNGSASYQRNRTAGSGKTAPEEADLYQAGFDALWEMDIFGGIRRSIESAEATVKATQEDLHNVQISLASEVALNYIKLRGFQQQIVVAEENLKAEKHTAEITRQKQRAGFVGTLDVANAEAQVATTRAQIPLLQVSSRQAIYALSVLLGRQPASLLGELSKTEPLPVTPPDVPAGLPSELLRRRPDIRQAEAQLHAATAQIGVAEADLFPKFSLTGSLSWQSNLFHDWFTGSSRGSSFGPAMDWAIFQGGAIRSNIRMQKALQDQAVISYKKTVLTALQEVENALYAYDKEKEHRSALSEAVIASRKAVAVSKQLYSAGQTDFLNVLQAQATLYASQNAFVQSNSNTCQDVIALYKALGGHWETYSSPSSNTKNNPQKHSLND